MPDFFKGDFVKYDLNVNDLDVLNFLKNYPVENLKKDFNYVIDYL